VRRMWLWIASLTGRRLAPSRRLAKMVWTAPDGISVPDW
jgi:hypothetical protein